MAWLHTWSGLLVCWLLLMVFCAGTATYYRNEITLWMTPQLHALALAEADPACAVAPADMADKGAAIMQQRAPHAQRWAINLAEPRIPAMRIYWQDAPPPGSTKKGKYQNLSLDPITGAKLPVLRATRGGEFFYRLHFELYNMDPTTGRCIVGFCTMFMLVAIVSGVITHKRIFQDFFTFRPGKGARSWLDAHNASAVLALPYHLMITYTGLVASLLIYMPYGARAVYRDDVKTQTAEIFPEAALRKKASGVAAPLAPVGPMVRQAEAHWHGAPAGKVAVDFSNDANAVVSIEQRDGARLSQVRPTMVFDGVTGALIDTVGEHAAPASATRGVMVGLHIATFAHPLLRFLFFVCGLAGCAMVATGALLWTRRERAQQDKNNAISLGAKIGLRLAEALNIGAIAGLPVAIAAYFWANRLLPSALAQRADVEIRCFFIAWALLTVLALVSPGRAMWRFQLSLAGAAFAFIPVLNAFTTDSHLGAALAGKVPLPVAGFDLVMLMLGGVFGFAAWKLRGPGAVASPRSASRREDAAEWHGGDPAPSMEAA